MNCDSGAEQFGSQVIAMPYPGRGHINPMMNLCHSLSSRTTHTLFTFVVTEEWYGFIGSDSTPANIRFATIPNVVPSELVRAANFQAFLEAVQTNMEEPLEQLIDRLGLPVSCIIADTFLPWAVSLGNRRNIPVASLFTMSASVFSMFYHFDLIVENHHFPVEISERGDECVDYIPGISSLRVADLPTILFGEVGRRSLPMALDSISLTPKAQYLVFTSVYELEHDAIDALKATLSIPIYTFGPSIPYLKLRENPSTSTNNGSDFSYLKWLDSKPPGSVLYVSLGSFLSVSSAQMDEIAGGLKDSGVAYLWVARGETSRLNEARGSKSPGLIVPWCDQLRVLCHSSVGGFWTHCGWNSVLEGVFAGMPMITFPLHMDQVPNKKQIVRDWKSGWRVKEDAGAEKFVNKEEIAELLRRFMDLESTERKEMTSWVEELKEVSRQAIEKGGSSYTNVDAFIRDISQ